MTSAWFGLKNIANFLRLLLTYVVPLIVVGGLILCGLWIVPDILFGMYGNVDGKWMSWNHRCIMEWSSFLNFGPYSPFSGTGSLFLPNLPWLNPGALALGIPAPIEYKHLFSYFVYLTELTLSTYFLFSELKIDRAYAFTAVLLYLSFFFIPFNSVSGTPSWYSLAPFFAHQAAAMNLATVALLRSGRSTLWPNLFWGLVFIACLFSAFSSAPMFNLVYVPVYAVLWTLLVFSTASDRRALPFRIGLISSHGRRILDHRPPWLSIGHGSGIGTRQQPSAFPTSRDGIAYGGLLGWIDLTLFDLLPITRRCF